MTPEETAEVIAALEAHVQELEIQRSFKVEGAQPRLVISERVLDRLKDEQMRLFDLS
jgi:hypothetical protein